MKCAAVVGYFVVLSALRADPVFSVVHAFDGSVGATPKSALMQASDGNIYGTAFAGGANNSGSVFKVTLSGVVAPLYSFTGGNDGGNPVAAVRQGTDGALYGTTFAGGSNNLGVIYKIATDGFLTSLYSFNGSDGSHPTGRLVQGADGNFYGDTYDGGASDKGTIFKVTTQGALTTLYSFSGSDGANPYAGLVYGVDGNLYGVCSSGGPSAEGTLFGAGVTGGMSIIYPFGGGDEGGNPFGDLFQTSDGNLFGTTYNGGSGYGTVFRLSPPGGLHLSGGVDGANPRGGMIIAADGNAYGTTEAGASGYGTVFQVPLGNPSFNTLYAFTNGLDGATPVSGLLLASDGNLWGVARDGGANQLGTIYKIYITPPASVLLNVGVTDSGVAISWKSVKDRTYQLQSCSDLPSVWHNVADVITASADTTRVVVPTDQAQKYFRLLALPGTAPLPTLANVGFEVPSAGPPGQFYSFIYNPFNASWTFTGNAGVAVNGSGFAVYHPPTADGSQFAFLQNIDAQGGSMEQTVALTNGWYSLQFLCSQRDISGRDNFTNQTIHLEVDTTTIESITPADTNWVSHVSLPFRVSTGAHTIRFSAPGGIGNSTALVDTVSLGSSTDTNGVIVP